MRASNERVTVEIKSQPIDIGDISRRDREPYGDQDEENKTNKNQKGNILRIAHFVVHLKSTLKDPSLSACGI